jgi:hypothetical protein
MSVSLVRKGEHIVKTQEHHHTTVVLLSAISVRVQYKEQSSKTSVDREFICMDEDRQLVFL